MGLPLRSEFELEGEGEENFANPHLLFKILQPSPYLAEYFPKFSGASGVKLVTFYCDIFFFQNVPFSSKLLIQFFLKRPVV